MVIEWKYQITATITEDVSFQYSHTFKTFLKRNLLELDRIRFLLMEKPPLFISMFSFPKRISRFGILWVYKLFYTQYMFPGGKTRGIWQRKVF